MKTLLLSVTMLATAMLFWFCKQTRYTPAAFPEEQLRWGSGGGFVGRETKFTLLKNGQIFKFESRDSIGELEKIKAGKAKALFETAASLNIAKLDFQHPGNTYDFLEFQEGAVIQRISWGDANHPVDAKIKELFAQLKELNKTK